MARVISELPEEIREASKRVRSPVIMNAPEVLKTGLMRCASPWSDTTSRTRSPLSPMSRHSQRRRLGSPGLDFQSTFSLPGTNRYTPYDGVHSAAMRTANRGQGYFMPYETLGPPEQGTAPPSLPQHLTKLQPKTLTFGTRKSARLSTHTSTLLPNLRKGHFERPLVNKEQILEGGVFRNVGLGFLPDGADLTPLFGEVMHVGKIESDYRVEGAKPTIKPKKLKHIETVLLDTLREPYPSLEDLHFPEPKSMKTPPTTPRPSSPDITLQPKALSTQETRKESGVTQDDTDQKVDFDSDDDRSSISSTGPWPKRETRTADIDEDETTFVIKTITTIKMDAYTFAISNGKVVSSSPVFQTYLKRTRAPSGQLWDAIERLEKFTKEYDIPWLEISCHRLEEWLCQPLVERFRLLDFLGVTFDHHRLLRRVKAPGSRYKGIDGEQHAAAKIQATWRMYQARRAYIETMGKIYAGRCFLLYWRVRQRRLEMRALLKKAYSKHVTHYRHVMRKFAHRWPTLKFSPRTIVHLPAISCDLKSREVMGDTWERQMRQLGRLFEAGQTSDDCEVELVIILPQMEYGDERHFNSLLDRSFRNYSVQYIRCENSIHFPKSASLTNMLLASPRALRELRKAVRGKSAYIIPGIVGEQEVRLSSMTDIPLMSPDHELTEKFGKSGVREFIKAAGYENDIISVDKITDEETFADTIYSLMKTYKNVARWLFKVNHFLASVRGIAYLDVRSIDLQQRKEDVIAQVRQNIKIVTKHVKNIQHFLHVFFNVGNGGVIESVPFLDAPTVAVNFLIEPGGKCSVVGTAEHLPVEEFEYSGSIFPQQHANHNALVEITNQFAKVLFDKGVIGYVELECLVVGDRLIPVDITPHYSETLHQQNFVLLSTGAQFNPDDGKIYYNVNLTRKLKLHFLDQVRYLDYGHLKKSSGTENIDTPLLEERIAIWSDAYEHDHLQMIHKNAMLTICKNAGIDFDLRERTGTILPSFTMSTSKKRMSMICVSNSVLNTVEMCIANLAAINQRLNSKSLQGSSNFRKFAFKLIKMMRGLPGDIGILLPTDTDVSRLSSGVNEIHEAFSAESLLKFIENIPEDSRHNIHELLINLLKSEIASRHPDNDETEEEAEAKKQRAAHLTSISKVDHDIIQLCAEEIPSLKLNEDPEWNRLPDPDEMPPKESLWADDVAKELKELLRNIQEQEAEASKKKKNTKRKNLSLSKEMALENDDQNEQSHKGVEVLSESVNQVTQPIQTMSNQLDSIAESTAQTSSVVSLSSKSTLSKTNETGIQEKLKRRVADQMANGMERSASQASSDSRARTRPFSSEESNAKDPSPSSSHPSSASHPTKRQASGSSRRDKQQAASSGHDRQHSSSSATRHEKNNSSSSHHERQTSASSQNGKHQKQTSSSTRVDGHRSSSISSRRGVGSATQKTTPQKAS